MLSGKTIRARLTFCTAGSTEGERQGGGWRDLATEPDQGEQSTAVVHGRSLGGGCRHRPRGVRRIAGRRADDRHELHEQPRGEAGRGPDRGPPAWSRAEHGAGDRPVRLPDGRRGRVPCVCRRAPAGHRNPRARGRHSHAVLLPARRPVTRVRRSADHAGRGHAPCRGRGGPRGDSGPAGRAGSP
jgi:hypothetical protein